MRNALVLVIIAVLAGACGKKQAPASPKAPADEKAQDADKATDGEAPNTTPTPLKKSSDPDEGGE